MPPKATQRRKNLSPQTPLPSPPSLYPKNPIPSGFNLPFFNSSLSQPFIPLLPRPKGK
jgi:hypothetical protein